MLPACFCTLALPAHARPKHHFADTREMVACSQSDMRPCEQPKGGNPTFERYGAWSHRWCGWWLGRHLGMHDRRPSASLPARRREAGWLLSGNDGSAVRERVRSVQRDSFQVAVMGESPTSGFAPLGDGRSGHCSAVDRFAACQTKRLGVRSNRSCSLVHE